MPSGAQIRNPLEHLSNIHSDVIRIVYMSNMFSISLTFISTIFSMSGVQSVVPSVGRGDDTVGNPHHGQIDQFELFELKLLSSSCSSLSSH